MKQSILLVEDNVDLAQGMSIYLRDHGYTVEHASDGELGLEMALSGGYSLLILDLGLPKLDGLEVMFQVRRVDSKLPIIILTSRSEEIDKVVGLNKGADDYITKPFNVAELLARVNALLRRAREVSDTVSPVLGDTLEIGELSINLGSRSIAVKGVEVKFSSTEFDILVFLAKNAGQAFSREEILENVWEYGAGDYEQAVNSMMVRIRKKIEKDPANPKYIKTIRGFGYRFADPKEL